MRYYLRHGGAPRIGKVAGRKFAVLGKSQEEIRIRDNFPETWLWETFDIG